MTKHRKQTLLKITYYKLDLFNFLGEVVDAGFDVVVDEVFDFLCSLMIKVNSFGLCIHIVIYIAKILMD